MWSHACVCPVLVASCRWPVQACDRISVLSHASWRPWEAAIVAVGEPGRLSTGERTLPGGLGVPDFYKRGGSWIQLGPTAGSSELETIAV